MNRLQQSSQASTSSPSLPSLFPGDNFQHHDLSTSEFSTHLSQVAVDTNVVEDFDGMESNIMQENFTEAFYEIELPVPEETTEIPIGIIHDNSDMSADSDSDSDVEVSSSDSSEELDDSDVTTIHWTPLMKVKVMFPKKKHFLPKKTHVWLFLP